MLPVLTTRYVTFCVTIAVILFISMRFDMIWDRKFITSWENAYFSGMNYRIFGIHPVLEALQADQTIDKILVQSNLRNENIRKILKLAGEKKVPVQQVPAEKLNRLTRKNHQGIFAFLSPVEYSRLDVVVPEIFESGKQPLILILDRISDTRNFGAILRTCDAAGVDAVVVPEKGAASITEDAVKTSAGAVFSIPVCKEKNLMRSIEFLQQCGIAVLSATEKTEDLLYNTDLKQPIAIIMGSEEDGVSDQLIKVSDYKAKLPMKGNIGSLNVSVACGAMLYEVVRQRLG